MTPRALVLEVLVRPLYWMILAASVVVLYRGHNEPGGGFIGALMAVSATGLCAAAYGPGVARRRLPLRSASALAAVGGLLSLLAGAWGPVVGEAFLTHQTLRVELGPIAFELATVLAFDVGVYLGVWGALAGYVLALFEPADTPTEAGA